MPVRPDPANNFIHALSDFWTVFFQDTTQIQAYFQGVEINLGQLYLEMLEAVLGTSLQHIPVFSRKYLAQVTLSEDATFFVEGADRDLWTFRPAGAPMVALQSLMNRAIVPTQVLESGRDYDVVDNNIRFNINPFDIDGAGTSLPYFPVRHVTKTFAATLRDPLRRSWSALGVHPGDALRYRSLTAKILKVEGDTLFLDTSFPEFTQDLFTKPFKLTTLRAPFDAVKSGVSAPSHPTEVGAFTAASLASTKTLEMAASPEYRGVWAPATSYAAGDFVLAPGPVLMRAKLAHTSPAAFTATPWETLLDKYVYVHTDDPFIDGIGQVVSVSGTMITLNRVMDFKSAATVQAYVIAYPEGVLGSLPQPTLRLPHSFLNAGSLRVTARRAHPVYVPGELTPRPANEGVVAGIDYAFDVDAGVIFPLTGWDPTFPATLSYTWSLATVSQVFTPRNSWSTGAYYAVGDMAEHLGARYTCVSANSDAAFDAAKWVQYSAPFSLGVATTVRELAAWGAEALTDRQALYTNFGYLLAFKRPSSEQYRAFLRGVAQLFVIGPALERFESTLNVMAGLPVIRDDGEVLLGYDSGAHASGSDGQLIDTFEGRDGVLTASTSRFSASTADFFPSDVGAAVRVKVGVGYVTYTVTSVISPSTVTVAPVPEDGSALVWQAQHITLTRRFRTSSYAFSASDVDALIVIENAANDRNVGAFRIVSVENASTVILESVAGFIDEAALSWTISRTKSKTITTTRARYTVPLGVPIRDAVTAPSSLNVLTFKAFEPLTDAFIVSDYLQDPTWWHNTEIPKELLRFTVESAGRRRVSPNFIEHRVNPLDGALIGDVGLGVGVDDEGHPGIARSGGAVWYGGAEVTLDAGYPRASSRDVGTYLTLDGLGVHAQFKITGVAGDRVLLERFPPRAWGAPTPPVAVSVSLAPLLYRRVVGFIMMDRYLKYHALRVQVSSATPLDSGFLGEAIQLLKAAKPAYTYVYFETPLDFLDRLVAADLDVLLDVGAPLRDAFLVADNTPRVGGLLRAGDTFVFTDETQVIPAALGTYALTPTLPAVGSPVFHAVKGRFGLTPPVPVEGVDYTFDRLNGSVTVLQALTGPLAFNYVCVILRTRAVGDLLDAGETPVVVNGTDPTTWWAAGQTPGDAGCIDRAVQVTIGP